jgi:hypothetical protein
MKRYQPTIQEYGSISKPEMRENEHGKWYSREDVDVLREYLRVYGGHIPPCAGRPCECGFQKAWEVAGLDSQPGAGT